MADPKRDRIGYEMHRLAFRALLAGALRRRPRVVLALMLALAVAAALRETADTWLGPHGSDRVLLGLANVPDLVRQGQVWRLVTATLLHGDLSHLALNLVGLFVLGRPIESAWGPARFGLIYAAAALAGSLATVARGAALSVGASGALFGLLAALVALGVRLWPRLTPGLRVSLVALPALLLVTMLGLGALVQDGAAARVDLNAHIGGALGGFALAMALRPMLPEGDDPALGAPGRSRWPELAAWAVLALAATAVGVAAWHLRDPWTIAPARKETFRFDGVQVGYPAGARRGLWRDGVCQGSLADGAWALHTGRRLCFDLPLGAVVLIDRRDRLLTMDAGDIAAMHAANRTGRFVRRQESVMLYPLGRDLLYALVAAEPLLEAHARALQPVLPPAGSAWIDAPRRDWKLFDFIELPLAMTWTTAPIE